mgnify:CR=1 FL=1
MKTPFGGSRLVTERALACERHDDVTALAGATFKLVEEPEGLSLTVLRDADFEHAGDVTNRLAGERRPTAVRQLLGCEDVVHVAVERFGQDLRDTDMRFELGRAILDAINGRGGQAGVLSKLGDGETGVFAKLLQLVQRNS